MQKLFDKCVENLKAMSFRAGKIETNEEGHSSFKCMYMSPANKKCIVGQLFDDVTAANMELDWPGQSINNIMFSTRVLDRYQFLKDTDTLEMLQEFQYAHDSVYSWGDDGFMAWDRVHDLARKFNLDASNVPKYAQEDA